MRGTGIRESWKVFNKHEEVSIKLKNELLAVSENNSYTQTALIYATSEQRFSTAKHLSHTD